MIYAPVPLKDKRLEKVYCRAIKELNKFWGLNWVRRTPQVFVVPTRKAFDEFLGGKTQPWMVGHSADNRILLLAQEKTGIESAWVYPQKQYDALLKHELCHAFLRAYVGTDAFVPRWLNEGTSLYLANQLQFRKKPLKFKGFLSCYNNGNNSEALYGESGFVVELLIKSFGQTKFLRLLKGLRLIKTHKDFDRHFKTVYKFAPTYKKLNEILARG